MRYDTLNAVIQTIDAKKYLEIGFQNGINFSHIICDSKSAVDPAPVVSEQRCHIMTSDDFFKQNTDKFDVIFIDGLHTYEQVKKDFNNALSALNPNGAICFHDTSPKNEEYARSFADGGQWNGDCYKIVIDLYSGEYKFKYFTVNEDHGVTVVFPSVVENRDNIYVEHNYQWYDANRDTIMRFQ